MVRDAKAVGEILQHSTTVTQNTMCHYTNMKSRSDRQSSNERRLIIIVQKNSC